MAKQEQTAGIGDEAMTATTGTTRAQWFALLDRAGAHRLAHQEITSLLGEFGVVPWWCQMVTVEYERAKGLRARHQTATGFNASVSKVIGTDLAKLYAATADGKTRKTWFPDGDFELTSETKGKYFRGRWNGEGRLEINFYSKGAGKAQIVVQVGKLGAAADVAREKACWKAALEDLKAKLEKRPRKAASKG
jgi:hypothetical protein